MRAKPKIKLTALASCAGCASKLNQKALRQILPRFSAAKNKRVLVDSGTGDDAGVYRLDRENALVQTIDFFMPIVDDPFSYGQIAAANAISDVFAMGGRPLTALNVVGFPADLVPPAAITEILRGAREKAQEANCAVVGGHTIRNPEPVFGLSVTGMVRLRHLITNARARPNDRLVLTKPLGTGIVTTALKRGRASAALERKTINLMRTINSVGAVLAEARLVNAATDITGFGLMGHLASMCRASQVSAEIDSGAIPAIDPEIFELIDDGLVPGGSRDNLKLADTLTHWNGTPQNLRTLMCDAQTSGGLLLAVSPGKLSHVLNLLDRNKTLCARVIGRITPRSDRLLCIKE